MQTQAPERDLPEPKFEVVKMTEDSDGMKQWLVKCQHKHRVRVIHPIKNDKVKPPSYGQTDHVLVTQRSHSTEVDGETREFYQTSVYGSDAEGNFYDAAIYVTPGIREVWEAMYAIGEI